LNEDWYEDVKDADWQPAKREVGEITFKKVSQGKRAKAFLKTVSFILIAAVSGGASGAYIVEKKYSNKMYSINTPLIVNRSDDKNDDYPSGNVITRIAYTVGPAVVGISNKVEGFLGEREAQGGSGIIFNSEGYIVTNNHVIEGSDKITVKLSNGKEFQAKCIGIDATADIAVIKIDAFNLPTAKFGNSSKVSVGDPAVAIGNPLGEEFAGTVTSGIISGVNRRIKIGDAYYKLLQTDAAINPGNSGGALCNSLGEVIGINSFKIESAYNGNIEGVGFALSINEVDQVIKRIRKAPNTPSSNNVEKGKVVRIGIEGEEVVCDLNKNIKGIYVKAVTKGSGAAVAGLKPTDIIVEVDNVKVAKIKELDEAISRHTSSDALVCKVLRNGQMMNFTIKLL